MQRLCVILGVLVAVGGCGGRPAGIPPRGKVEQEIRIRVACPNQITSTMLTRYGQHWAERQRVRLSTHVYDPARGPESAGECDVWILPTAELPHWAAADRLHPLPLQILAGNASYAWNDVLGLYRVKLLTWEQKVFALPFFCEEIMLFYRGDLFGQAQNQAEFAREYGRKLTAPDTWEHYLDIAEFFTLKKRQGRDKAGPSLPPLPRDADELEREFYSVVVPYARRSIREDAVPSPTSRELFSFHYDVETGDPRIGSSGFEHGLAQMQKMQRFRPAGMAGAPAEAFLKGEAVMCLAPPSWVARFQAAEKLRGKFDIHRLPGSAVYFDFHTDDKRQPASDNYVPYLAGRGWLAAVPRSNPDPEPAFGLMIELSGPRQSQEIVIEPSWGGGVFRGEHLAVRSGWQAFGLEPHALERMLDVLRTSVLQTRIQNPVTRLRIPREAEYRRALLKEIVAALVENKDARAALQAAAAAWRKLDEPLGKLNRIREYRLSLGLVSAD